MSLMDRLTPEQMARVVLRLHDALERSAVPPHLHEGLLRYVRDGILPGSFLQAVLCNNLTQALLRADPQAFWALRPLVELLLDAAPQMAWGSRDKVLAWTRTPDRLEV